MTELVAEDWTRRQILITSRRTFSPWVWLCCWSLVRNEGSSGGSRCVGRQWILVVVFRVSGRMVEERAADASEGNGFYWKGWRVYGANQSDRELESAQLQFGHFVCRLAAVCGELGGGGQWHCVSGRRKKFGGGDVHDRLVRR